MFFKKLFVGNNLETSALHAQSISNLRGRTYFGRGLRGRDEAEDLIGAEEYYARLLLGVFNEKNNDESAIFLPGYDGHVAGCPTNMLQEAYSGTAYPFKNYGDISYGGKLPNGSRILFGFCGKKSAGAAGYPVLYLYKSPWTWGYSVGANDENWKTVFGDCTPGGTDNGAIISSIYHMPNAASGTSYARGCFVSFNTHPWGDRYTG